MITKNISKNQIKNIYSDYTVFTVEHNVDALGDFGFILISCIGRDVSIDFGKYTERHFFHGCNTPFWFIFDIIVFSFAAPLLYLFIRNKYIGIASVSLLSIGALYGVHIPSDLFYYHMTIIFLHLRSYYWLSFFDYAKAQQPLLFGALWIFSLKKSRCGQSIAVLLPFMPCTLMRQ